MPTSKGALAGNPANANRGGGSTGGGVGGSFGGGRGGNPTGLSIPRTLSPSGRNLDATVSASISPEAEAFAKILRALLLESAGGSSLL